jgi:pantoate--beta-alanine ligase
MPELISEGKTLRERLSNLRRQGLSIGFVPTMGALHTGHAELLDVARRENAFVVVSIFVNPLQFDRPEDLDKYPRTMEDDLDICDEHGVDLVFAPTPAELYPQEQLAFVDVPALTESLCGQRRPGHFRGVTTVVLKLFNLVQPDKAYFGEKDAQQLAVIRRMAQDLDVPVTVVPVPTVRELDGLALSSRNKHLTAAERQIAPVLSRALQHALHLITNGERSVAAIQRAVLPLFAKYPEVRIEYFEITDPNTLMPMECVDRPALLAGAIWLGSTRLIDNLSWPGQSPMA